MDGVHVRINAAPDVAQQFYTTLIQRAPSLAHITAHRIEQVDFAPAFDFQIVESSNGIRPNVPLTPDFALCKSCRKELLTPQNRRYQYPFITCTACGPRYSIIKALPYDRARTTMAPFTFCKSCEREYHDPMDRRYYSQTNSCAACGIELTLWAKRTKAFYKVYSETIPILATVQQAWADGKIVAIKGIGGYLLTCDATNGNAIRTLRKRKNRPVKPLAVMFPNLEKLMEVATVQPAAESLLTGAVAPIVLLPLTSEAATILPLEQIASGYQQLGAMLPYTPLYELLLHQFGQPIIATSGNLTNEPIIYEDQEAIKKLAVIADLIVSNNRAIVVPQDDSVVRFAQNSQQPILIRRSRGYAPSFIQAGSNWPTTETVLSLGALMKGAIGVLDQGNTYISQYLGSLEQFDALETYQKVLYHLLELMEATPTQLVCDAHPDYFTTQLGERLSAKWQIPLLRVQHHIAHFAAVLGEHQLTNSMEPVLGFCWDGTGLGTDEAIWGSECFIYQNGRFQRQHHLAYFNHILGDKMAKEPRIAALSVAWALPFAERLLRDKFTSSEWFIYNKYLKHGKGVKTSSMGRLFDAVACILGIADKVSYEGQAAAELEQWARRYWNQNGLGQITSYLPTHQVAAAIPTQQIVEGIAKDCLKGQSKGYIALCFHFTLVQLVKTMAEQQGLRKLAFSGGVFQNEVLVDLLSEVLGATHQLFFHQQLSPNDENIAFGQLVYWNILAKAHKIETSSSVLESYQVE